MTSTFSIIPRGRLKAIRSKEDIIRLVHAKDLDHMLARYKRAAAGLHAQLGFDGSLGWIDFGEYLQQLSDELRNSVLAERSIAPVRDHVMRDRPPRRSAARACCQ